jgi:glycosyltransferase involved in cell wall biosynthesis
MTPMISVITPCFNEEETIAECVRRTAKVFAELMPEIDYEHIFADNASTDNTFSILAELAKTNPRIKVFVNSRNIGPFRNMYRGMSKARGEAIIPMLPADLQDPPEIIPDFVRLWRAGSLVVFGERTNRQEGILLRTLRGIYYRIVRRFAEGNIPINSGEFMLIDRSISDSLLALNDQYPYIRGLVAQSVDVSSSVKYKWEARTEGKSHSNWFSLLDQAINGFVSTSRIPARLALIGGFAISGLGILVGAYSLLMNLFASNGATSGIPTLIVAEFFFGGLQLFFLGLIGEYVLSIHAQVRKLPKAFDVKSINFD